MQMYIIYEYKATKEFALPGGDERVLKQIGQATSKFKKTEICRIET